MTHDIDNTHGIDLDSWYRIGTTESHTYERAECYPYAGFFFFFSGQTGGASQGRVCCQRGLPDLVFLISDIKWEFRYSPKFTLHRQTGDTESLDVFAEKHRRKRRRIFFSPYINCLLPVMCHLSVSLVPYQISPDHHSMQLCTL